jgi:glycosyltransferase involved in cell wall biosynthesis
MNTAPTLSIIIPVYNGERFIDDCLQALFNQTCSPHEILVVDDGSTDLTAQRIIPPARRLSTSGRIGAGAARNLGAQHATGDILLFTDIDVVAPPNWIEKTLHVIQNHQVRCGGGGYCGPVEQTFIQWFAHNELVWRRKHLHGYVETLVSNNLFCERTLFKEIGGFPESYRRASSEDMEFSWTVSRNHQLWWERDNGVFHNFTPTLTAYLNQQKRFAIDAVPMLFKRREMVSGITHHPPTFYLEIGLTALSLITLISSSFQVVLLYLFLFFMVSIAVLNQGFIFSMSKRKSVYFIPTVSLIYLRNLTILWGGCIGVGHLLIRRDN